jgi:hypothetical protein
MRRSIPAGTRRRRKRWASCACAFLIGQARALIADASRRSAGSATARNGAPDAKDASAWSSVYTGSAAPATYHPPNFSPSISVPGLFPCPAKGTFELGADPKTLFFSKYKIFQRRWCAHLKIKSCDMINPFFKPAAFVGSSQDIGYQIRPSTGAPRSFAVS